MNTPRVSFLLPCLNARRFLEARVESLLAQTMTDWEAIVLDSHSDDGSWEYFERTAAADPRFLLHRLPREGLYAALNHGIDLARGEFLSIATCDDTMEPVFLSRLLAALKEVPEAGLAACDLRFIDAAGEETSSNGRFGSDRVRTAIVGQVLDQVNYRPPPHDCLLHFAGETVCWSLTQLLVRTSLARRSPRFEVNVGTVADFGWLLNLTNLAGSVHVPRKLATWRTHGDQLSFQPDPSLPGHLAALCRTGAERLHQQHECLLSRNDHAALLLPSKILQAQEAKHSLTVITYYLESGLRFLGMVVERPIASWEALVRAKFKLHAKHLKQAFVGFILNRTGVYPRPIGHPLD